MAKMKPVRCVKCERRRAFTHYYNIGYMCDECFNALPRPKKREATHPNELLAEELGDMFDPDMYGG